MLYLDDMSKNEGDYCKVLNAKESALYFWRSFIEARQILCIESGNLSEQEPLSDPILHIIFSLYERTSLK